MTNNKQQTAVEWLINYFNSYDRIKEMLDCFEYEIKQAKEMDKQRIAKAFTDGKGQNFSFYDKTGEEYYNETYGGNK